ncbi:Transcriptional regulator, TetR family [Labilithrix luteola]|uniref:Transcriptional regulator, TetR family n=1 Tax=Labilithrix luteola TaxID=1391654 RepID=A0A0K1QCW1_9BACT|nr:TetR/AcrR family transcriptional regulator [Labilithrix luteola]AKV03250.1 Transcriptional regulator, TetR family [Labilithrix luteola]
MRRSVYKKSEDSKLQVLDAAIATLAKRGIADTSVQDIANAAKLSKGSVHYHFASKDELYERVLERCCETIEKRVVEVFEQPGAPMERVRRAVLEMWSQRRDGLPELQVLQELFTLSRQNPAIRQALADALKRSRKQIVDIGFARLLELGLKPKVGVDVAARLLLAALDGLSLHHAVDPITTSEQTEMLRTLEAMMIAIFEL